MPGPGRVTGLALALACLGAVLAGCDHASTRAAGADSVAALRAAGDFAAARRAAERRVAAIASRPSTRPWVLADARLAAATLARIEALPESARAQLRAAERVRPDTVSLDSDWRGTIPALRRQLAARARWLGVDHPDVADTRSALARIELGQGNPASADSLDQLARAARLRAFGPEHPRVLENDRQLTRGMRLASVGHEVVARRAEEHLRLARRLFPPGSDALGDVVLETANANRADDRPERCDALFGEALRIRRRLHGARSAPVAQVLADWGVTENFFRRPRAAQALIARAVAIYERTDAGPLRERAMAWNSAGTTLLPLRRPARALPLLRRAAAMQETLRASARPGSSSSRMFPLSAWSDLAIAQVLTGDSTAALASLDRGLSRGIVESARRRGELPERDPWDGLVSRLERALPDSAAMIGWLEPADRGFVGEWFWCWVVRPGAGVRWIAVTNTQPDPARWPDAYVRALRYRLLAAGGWPVQVRETPEFDSVLVTVWRHRFAPMLPALAGVRELVVCSPSVHHGVPLEALHGPDGRAPGMDYTITYTPSALLFLLGRERARTGRVPRPPRALLIGAAGLHRGGGQAPDLRLVDEEIARLRSRIPGARVLAGPAATESAIDRQRRGRAWQDLDLLHFSGHQHTHPVFANEAGIVLDDAHRRGDRPFRAEVDATDGRLTPAEIRTWHLGARLVVLASCRSLGNYYARSDGFVGTGQAFLEAGAHQLVVSLWDVDDRATSLLVDRFYAEWLAPGRPRTVAEALHRARRAVRDWRAPDGSKPYHHPAYWAGFVVLGLGEGAERGARPAP